MITLYGRTYWDAELHVPLATLGEGKGKVDTKIAMAMGGFACNAARTLCARFPSGSVRVVTLTSPGDVARLRSRLPTDVVLDAMTSDDDRLAWPAVTVVINPSAECRILRDPMQHTDDLWQVERVPEAALASSLHVLGRLPEPFVGGVLERAHARGAKVAWCGGDALPQDLEVQFDYLCVNAAEAARLLGGDSESPTASARALARRASAANAVRLVTGRGTAPTAAALRDGGEVRCHEAAPEPVARNDIKTLFRVGDVFAAHFLASACFDEGDIAGALDMAHRSATRFIQGKGGNDV